ncbi:MAG: CDGSH iron-sulfur domain-containing protein [Phycisphaera sp.]|nr:CDGSH iron-sulfur domain-containing protein [Phycisphaera sp.]
MARLVRHDATGPIELKPQEKSAWVCACGLSQNLPLCDGSHKIAKQNDKPGKVCVYDKTRTKVIEVRDDV